MLQNAHGPVHCYLCYRCQSQKEIFPWLCISITSALRIRPRGKGALESHQRELQPRNYTKICKNCSRTLVSIGFVCYLLSCCVAFFNRECLGETRQVSIGFPQGKELENTSRKITSARRQFPWCYHYKTLLWAHVREDKELIQKSKGRRKNMPRAAKALKKGCIWKEKKVILQKPKNQKLKDQNQKEIDPR